MSSADSFFEKALARVKERNYARALEMCIEVIRLDPCYTEAWVLIGNLYGIEGHPLPAVLAYQQAISLKPDLPDAWCNRGIGFANMAMWEMAQKSFAEAIRINPGMPEPHIELANVLAHNLNLDEADAEYRKALDLANIPNVHTQLGTVLMGQGKWDEGFPHYERRWQDTPYPPREFRMYPKWGGEDLNGKTIVVYPEQGLGDEILFLRYAGHLRHIYPRACIKLFARPAVLRLAQGIHGMNVRPVGSDEPADYSVPLMDIPMVLGMGSGEIPSQDWPYLGVGKADPAWELRVSHLSPGLNVGLCWEAGRRPIQPETRYLGEAKSIHPEWLAPLAVAGVNFVSLQLERDTLKRIPFEIHDWMDDIRDLHDTAELMKNLDLVISVDTAVAHLAGAIGVPVWNFVRFNAFWPWMRLCDGPSLWYSTMRLFVQPKQWDWHSPIASAAAMLTEEAKRHADLASAPARCANG